MNEPIMSFAEIARMVGVTPQCAFETYTRAIRKLRKAKALDTLLGLALLLEKERAERRKDERHEGIGVSETFENFSGLLDGVDAAPVLSEGHSGGSGVARPRAGSAGNGAAGAKWSPQARMERRQLEAEEIGPQAA